MVPIPSEKTLPQVSLYRPQVFRFCNDMTSCKDTILCAISLAGSHVIQEALIILPNSSTKPQISTFTFGEAVDPRRLTALLPPLSSEHTGLFSSLENELRKLKYFGVYRDQGLELITYVL